MIDCPPFLGELKMKKLPAYCSWNTNGKRWYVRFHRGTFSTNIQGEPGSDEFIEQYQDALNGIKRPRVWVIDNFWSHVDKSGGKNACWPWTKHIDDTGYGRAASRKNNRDVLSHRHAWTFTNGKIPKGLQVLHSCDNPPCCNPAHLFLGTHQDNMKDRNKKRRFSAVLTEKDVRIIRHKYSRGTTQIALAKEFKVTPSNISLICSRTNWSDV